MRTELINICSGVAKNNGLRVSTFMAIVEVESGGEGFDSKTGKILIQFEPSWYRKLTGYAPSGLWSVNKVDVQSKEWLAFNDAFAKNPTKAMEATSIGLPQIMGFHYSKLGFKTVNELWDYAKKGLPQQVDLLARFIKLNPQLIKAFNNKDYHMIAYIYNGSKYKEMAKKWGREPYNISLEKADNKFSKYN